MDCGRLSRDLGLAKQSNGQLDPFNFNDTRGAEFTLATELFRKDLKGKGGRYPGSWTLPVCDAGTWGKEWNFYYNATTTDATSDDDPDHHPPCLCGESEISKALQPSIIYLKLSHICT